MVWENKLHATGDDLGYKFLMALQNIIKWNSSNDLRVVTLWDVGYESGVERFKDSSSSAEFFHGSHLHMIYTWENFAYLVSGGLDLHWCFYGEINFPRCLLY